MTGRTLAKAERTWPKWKTMYRETDNTAKVKKKAHGAQFGGLANTTALEAPMDAGPIKKESVTLEEL